MSLRADEVDGRLGEAGGEVGVSLEDPLDRLGVALVAKGGGTDQQLWREKGESLEER